MFECRFTPVVFLATALAACAAQPGVEPSPGVPFPLTIELPAVLPLLEEEIRLPAVPLVVGPIALTVIYPTSTGLVAARDTSFMFGSVGTGNASLTINGYPVHVWPNGAWLAWMPFPSDSVMQFELIARTAMDSVRLTHEARRATRFVPPGVGPWIDSNSISPRGSVWWPKDEPLTISVRASEGSQVQVRLADGRRIPLVPDPRSSEVPWGIRAFDRDSANLRRRVESDHYVGSIVGEAIARHPGPVVGPPPDHQHRCPRPHMAEGGMTCPMQQESDSAAIDAVIEVIQGSDTVTATWPVRIAPLDGPVLVEFDDDTAGAGDTDRLTVGRAAPRATYHWFFPTGTRAAAVGRINGMLRLKLSRGAEAWVSAADAQPLPTGRTALRARVGSVVLTPEAAKVTARIPLSDRVTFRVWETESEIVVRLYSAYGDIDWIQYGGTDPFVERVSWDQSAADEVTITFKLANPVWGYRISWSGSDLVLEIRRPPAIDPHHPLRDRVILVDPGHPPAGATGPTGLTEAEANLAVAFKLRELLAEDGAIVVMSRTSDSAVGLWPRIKLANDINADILVSIHNNAFPDGVNPFTNNGSSVYYNHPRSIPLAFAVQRALVRRLGLRDLGVGRGDLALVRPTWMPAVLTEGLFMMLPRQEAALRTEEGQLLYARGVYDGIKAFLERRGEGG